MGNLTTSDWLKGGFPEPKSVSDNQRTFIYRRAHLLEKVLTTEQQVALRMMRFEYWVSNLSKSDASAIIARIKTYEEREKERRIAKGLKKKLKKCMSPDFGDDVCFFCGGTLDVSNPVAPSCTTCGRGAIRVQM